MKTFVYSDPHFNHELIRSLYRTQFADVDEMNEYMVDEYNKIINKKDKVYFLGDIGDKAGIEKYLPRMRGHKILILGNHDQQNKSFYKKYFEEVHDGGIFYSKRIILTHHPIPMEPGSINVHGHTHIIDLDSKEHANVCVERTDYKPINIRTFVNRLGETNIPNKRFLQEWYKDIQRPTIERDDLVLTEDGLIDVEKTLSKRKNKDI